MSAKSRENYFNEKITCSDHESDSGGAPFECDGEFPKRRTASSTDDSLQGHSSDEGGIFFSLCHFNANINLSVKKWDRHFAPCLWGCWAIQSDDGHLQSRKFPSATSSDDERAEGFAGKFISFKLSLVRYMRNQKSVKQLDAWEGLRRELKVGESGHDLI